MRLLHQYRQQGTRPQLLVIIQIFVSQGQAIDSLGHHLLHLMFDPIRIPIIDEAGGKLAQNPDAFLDLPQEQATAVAGDRSTVKLRPNLASLLGMKSEDKLVTLCSHKAVAPSWQNFFLTKELCHEATAFFYLL
jgi:hypothetical protein